MPEVFRGIDPAAAKKAGNASEKEKELFRLRIKLFFMDCGMMSHRETVVLMFPGTLSSLCRW